MMRIGVDIRMLSSGQTGGVPEYIANLMQYLTSYPADFKLFYSGRNKSDLNYSWIKNSNVEIFDLSYSNRLLFAQARAFNFPKIDRIMGGLDLFFSPHFYLAPLSENVPLVLTLHDLSFMQDHQFDFFPNKMKLWHYFMSPASQARKASHIITVSASTKDDVVGKYKISSDKVSVIYSGISGIFRRLENDDPLLGEVKNKFKIKNRFISTLSTIEPRKNIAQIIYAFNSLKKEKEFADLNLVIAGRLGWNYSKVLEIYSSSPFKKDIIFTEFVNENEKLALYNLSRIFVYTSFFEGFGFPPLEAMACGTPVIGALDSSLGEIIGNAGILIDPFNIKDLEESIKMILRNGNLNDYFKKKGMEKKDKFSWEKCANETFSVFKNVYEETK